MTYLTVCLPGLASDFPKSADVSVKEDLEDAYGQARTAGLPVVFGEVAAEVDAVFDKEMAMDLGAMSDELADSAVYHYYPPLAQVRKWLDQKKFTIEAEDEGIWYRHFLARKL